MTALTVSVERAELLADLREQLPHLSKRGRERTERTIRTLELEAAPGRAAEDAALRRLDAREDRR